MRPSSRARLGLLCWVAAIGISEVRSAAAQAVDRPIVILSQAQGGLDRVWPEAEQRIAAELRQAGMKIVVQQGQASGTDQRLAELADSTRKYSALAALCIVRDADGGEVSIWLEDAVTGKSLLRRIRTEGGESPDQLGQVALAVVELLHASFLEVRMKHRQNSQPEVLPEVERMVDEALGRQNPLQSAFAAGGAVAGSFRGIGPLFGPTIDVALVAFDALRTDLDLFFAAYSPTEHSEAGRAKLRLTRALLFAGYEPRRSQFFSPSAALGGGLAVAWADGKAAAGFKGDLDSALVGLVAVRLAGALRMNRLLRLTLSVSGALAFPEIALRFAGDSVAKLGRPLVEASLGVEFNLQ